MKIEIDINEKYAKQLAHSLYVEKGAGEYDEGFWFNMAIRYLIFESVSKQNYYYE